MPSRLDRRLASERTTERQRPLYPRIRQPDKLSGTISPRPDRPNQTQTPCRRETITKHLTPFNAVSFYPASHDKREHHSSTDKANRF
ncbi:hypothetical protein KCP69_02795 [Salmonella enterica subsp. enterica]|nr:hypothetical protein KCP69_02795 [Salmonella enterica subsp. enterica]